MGGHNKLTYEYVKSFIENNSDCKLLSNRYINSQSKLKIKCVCGEIFNRDFSSFKSKKSYLCKKCIIKNQSKKRAHSYKYVKNCIEKEYYKSIGIKYKLKSDKYSNSKNKIEIEDSLGYKYKTVFHNIIDNIKNNRKLKIFGKCNPYTTYNIKNWLKLNNKDFILISESYNGSHDYLQWKCNEGHTFNRTWNEVISGCGCSKCNEYNSEKNAKRILEMYNIKFQEQYKFDDLISPNSTTKLRFDFCILNEDNSIKTLLELDGQFHYKESTLIQDKNKRKESFKKQQLYDNIKNEYCKNNKIKLLRIPYWDFNRIEEILKYNKII